MGRSRGKALAAKYIAALEESWGGPPTTPKRIEAACHWIEERALGEGAHEPGWDSLPVTALRYPTYSREGIALDMRIWRAFQQAIVYAVREALRKYGCENHLRFLDMKAFLRHYRGEQN